MEEARKYEASLVEWKDKLKTEAVKQLQDRNSVLQDWAKRLEEQQEALAAGQVGEVSLYSLNVIIQGNHSTRKPPALAWFVLPGNPVRRSTCSGDVADGIAAHHKHKDVHD